MFAVLDFKRAGKFSYLVRYARLDSEEQMEIFAEYQRLINASELNKDGKAHKKGSKAQIEYETKIELYNALMNDGYYSIINANNQAAYQMKGKFEDVFSIFACPSKGQYEYEERTILDFFNHTVLQFADKVVASQAASFVKEYKEIRHANKDFFQSVLKYNTEREEAKVSKDYSNLNSTQMNIDTLNFIGDLMSMMSKYVFNSTSNCGAVRMF